MAVYLCEGELSGLTEEDLLVASGVGMILVLLKPFYERYGSLGGQFVAGCVVSELR